MDYTEIMKRMAGDRCAGLVSRSRRAIGAAALIHAIPMALLFLSIAMLSCHMLHV
ncbi:hypothetical protein J2741_002055 [Methanolinea mesophila]|uniref:hypothetical protein n=1 Tax=Methanolinea mesophila TaxID=547055 RepID=UPI001AE9DEDE|nr:hypothetical protein [Methanolinea mesophila]MBP1929508.1 hypothetical protein [Methanolinea mesophila]